MIKRKEMERLKGLIQGCKNARNEMELVVSKHKLDYIQQLIEAEKNVETALSILKEI